MGKTYVFVGHDEEIMGQVVKDECVAPNLDLLGLHVGPRGVFLV